MVHVIDPKESVTLVTVNYHSWDYVKFLTFTAGKLADSGWKEWLMMDNSPDQAQEHLLSKLPTVKVIPYELAQPCIDKAPYYKSGIYKNDYSCAVNVLVKHVTTKYTLLIDPDVALLQKSWDRILVEEAETNGYDAIGAPYHPRKWMNYTGYPCVIFLFIRTKLLQESNFDFCAYTNNPIRNRIDLLRMRYYPHLINRVLPQIVTGAAKDAGWRLPGLFKKHNSKVKTFDIPFITDAKNHFPGRRALMAPSEDEIFKRPSKGLFEAEDIYDTEYEEFWNNGALFATHRGRGSPRGYELEDYLSAEGRWAAGQPQLWFSRVMEHTGLDVEELRKYLPDPVDTTEARTGPL